MIWEYMVELYEILKNAPDDKTIMDSIVITHSKLQRYDKIFCSISGGSDSDILIDLSLNHKVIFDYLFKSSYMPV